MRHRIIGPPRDRRGERSLGIVPAAQRLERAGVDQMRFRRIAPCGERTRARRHRPRGIARIAQPRGQIVRRYRVARAHPGRFFGISADRTPRTVRTSWLDHAGLVSSVRSIRRVAMVRSGGKK